MKFNKAILIATLILSALAFGCGDAGTNTNTANTNVNSNIAKANTNPVAATTPVPEQTTNNAPTLTPMFKAYCLAMEKKDEAGIRRTFSKATLEDLAEDMKSEGSKTLVEYMSVDQVTTALCEIRNETITGDEAIAEIKTAAIPNGEKFIFVKEGGEWKLTMRSPALNSVKDTATNK